MYFFIDLESALDFLRVVCSVYHFLSCKSTRCSSGERENGGLNGEKGKTLAISIIMHGENTLSFLHNVRASQSSCEVVARFFEACVCLSTSTSTSFGSCSQFHSQSVFLFHVVLYLAVLSSIEMGRWFLDF